MSNESAESLITEDPRPKTLVTPESLLLVLTGDGKGKSSSAFGMMLRALAREWKVAVVQFVKSGNWNVGEEKMGRRLGVEWLTLGAGFTWESENLERDKATAADAWELASQLIHSGTYNLVILDELTYLMTWKWLSPELVVETLTNRPRHVNVVVTGRDAPQEIISVADTVSTVLNTKHAYEQGFKALRGVDY